MTEPERYCVLIRLGVKRKSKGENLRGSVFLGGGGLGRDFFKIILFKFFPHLSLGNFCPPSLLVFYLL